MRALLALFLCLALSGCLTNYEPLAHDPFDSMMGKRKETEKRLSTAAAEAVADGETKEALDLYEKLYASSPRQKDVALNYAQLLRKTGRAGQAEEVLNPFVTKGKGKIWNGADRLLLNEYAAALISLGKFTEAEKTLNAVLEDNDAKEFHADAYNLMGIALDAQGTHKEAEQMFRQALEGWKGDPTSVMNNLAMSLASQGMFDEALLLLRQALLEAPDKKEIARNIDLVNNLRQAVVPTAPVSVKKK